jgi:hypothetical protein
LLGLTRVDAERGMDAAGRPRRLPAGLGKARSDQPPPASSRPSPVPATRPEGLAARGISGRSLLAHELARAIQQRDGEAPPDLAVDERLEAHGPLVVSRQVSAGARAAAAREAEVDVAWSDDSWEFEDRVVSAVARSRGFRGISKSLLPFALNHPVGALHESLERRQFRPGHRIRVKVSANYDPDNSPSFTEVDVTSAEAAPAPAPAPAPAAPAAASGPRGERGEPSLQEQQDSLKRMYARAAADADRQGWSGMTLEVSNNGKALSPLSMATVGPQVTRPTTTVPLSESAAAQQLESLLAAVLQSRGQWRATFARTATGAMQLKRWERLPDAPPLPQAPAAPTAPRPRSAAEEFEAETGWVYPPRWNTALQNIAIHGLHEANPLSLKNLPYTIAGAAIPIAGMKLLTTDFDALGNVIRFEWEIDEEIVEATETQGLSELKPGDVIPTRNAGQQRVVEIQPGGKIVTEPLSTTTGEDNVWVQLSDDSVRAYRPSEVKGTAKPGQAASTPDGPGRVVSVGEKPPHSAQVRQQPLEPLLSAEELNRPVPQVKGLSGPRRQLTSAERANANEIQAVLMRMQKGDQAALNELAAFRAKPLTGDLSGWTELDLLPGNPGGLNQMRMIVRVRPDGFIEARLLQMH